MLVARKDRSYLMKKLRIEFVVYAVLLLFTSCAMVGSRIYQCYDGPPKPKTEVATILNQHWAYTWVNLYRNSRRLNPTRDIIGPAELEVTPGFVTMTAKGNMATVTRTLQTTNDIHINFDAKAGGIYFIECVVTQFRDPVTTRFSVRDVTDTTPAERRAMMERHPLDR